MTTAEDHDPYRTGTGAFEIWLRDAAGLGIAGTLVRADETTISFDIDYLSMRGAQREITGAMLRSGHAAVRRWDSTAVGEAVRSFRRAPASSAS